ncbi:MAG: TIGR03750 family conjugal transfer protein [Proteobacteria bacterium]|nr:TIGR03750 family conjugal transfer protein [Pseudomonadota bacterium]
MSNTNNILADRLNVEPAIFKGCSSSELGVIVTLAIIVWLPLSVLLAWLLGAPSMGLGIAGIAIVLTVVVTASVFQRIKRGRPDGYYQQRFIMWLAQLGLRRSPFICRDGSWAIGRSQPRF